MEKDEIRTQVEDQIAIWTSLHGRRGKKVTLTEGAINFICMMIGNIATDRSDYWDNSPTNSSEAQEYAISLIPNALNEIVISENNNRSIKISSWELSHALTRIIDHFCFIPKKK